MDDSLIIAEATSIEKIQALETAMREMPQEEIPVKHYFSEGVYAREIFIKKGTVLTGHIHKYSQLNILSKGEISVSTEEGIKRISAPFTIVSPPGTKRVAYAHEDCIWTTIHGTHETDVEKIESHFIAKDHNEYLEFCKNLMIEGD